MGTKIKTKKAMIIIADVILAFLFLNCVYSQGRVDQLKKDRKEVEELQQDYLNTLIEFKEYKEHSGVLSTGKEQ